MEWPAGEAALATGGASGISLGVARVLVGAGAKVAVADIDGPRAADMAEELADIGDTAIGLPLDVSDPGSWAGAADRAEEVLGPVSILCNIAGVIGGGRFDETATEAWRWVFSVNVEGVFIGGVDLPAPVQGPEAATRGVGSRSVDQ